MPGFTFKKVLELRLRDTPPTWLRVRPCQPRQHRQNKMHSMHAQPDPHQVAVALRCGPSHLLLPVLRLVCVGVNTEATNDRVLHAANIENSLRCAMRVAGVIYTSTYARCAWKLRFASLWSRITPDWAGTPMFVFATGHCLHASLVEIHDNSKTSKIKMPCLTSS